MLRQRFEGVGQLGRYDRNRSSGAPIVSELLSWKFPSTGSAVALHLARATVEGVRNRRAFRDVEHFVFFIGYPHSGSTLVGSLLNSHPEIVISHEASILRYVKPGITRQQLFALVLEGEKRFAAVGRGWMNIDYDFPGTHQGTFEHLRVVGDKHAHRASRQIQNDPLVLDRLRRIVSVPIRVLHLTRNPFDNITPLAKPSMADIAEIVHSLGSLNAIAASLTPPTTPVVECS